MSQSGCSRLSQRILIGLVTGVLTGLFLGEYAAPLGLVGRAYIGLQMSILPYMVVSLVGGIGGLGYDIVKLKSYEEFFFSNKARLDGVLISAEAGSAWTTIKPEYGVVIPKPHLSTPIAIAAAMPNQELMDFVDDWLTQQKTRGFLGQLYTTWILGEEAGHKSHRWSVMGNILHWVG